MLTIYSCHRRLVKKDNFNKFEVNKRRSSNDIVALLLQRHSSYDHDTQLIEETSRMFKLSIHPVLSKFSFVDTESVLDIYNLFKVDLCNRPRYEF